MKDLKIALAQINTIVGDLSGNSEKILFCINQSLKQDADLVVFPELAVTGYPPEDLLLKPYFIKDNIRCLKAIARATNDIIAIVGFVDSDKNGIYNSAAILNNGKIEYVYRKINLPNYGVFDEKRYFTPGRENILFKAGDVAFCVNICEDIWRPVNIATKKILEKSQLLINISASPYYLGKAKERQAILSQKAKKFKVSTVYCNLVGAQDELVFDGRSLVLDSGGEIIQEAKAFDEDLLIVDLPLGRKRKSSSKKKRPIDKVEEVYLALLLGVRDYVKKNNFKKVAIGLSGGIDSALVASIAVEALGKANVLAVSMPSKYSSMETQSDAQRLARNLGIRFANVPIDGVFDAYNDALSAHFTGMPEDITEENIQARIRGNILMAFSNKFGYLVLNTGNKSETSVGYCTLYGDMAGGFAVIKDVPKKLVYELAVFINKRKGKEIIPATIIKRPPSAELRPDQKDQDSLPPYDLLDDIVSLYIENDKSLGDIVKKLGNKDIVSKVLRMVDANEYKRRQAPPGIKITPRSFGKDRRMPITNKFTEDMYGRDKK